MITSGVFPVFNIKFKIGTKGVSSADADKVSIAEMETFQIAIDGNVEEWSPMELEGWLRRMVTGKAFSLSMAGKRHYGDAGNDYVASLALKTGVDCESIFEIEFPNGDKINFNCVVSVTNFMGGESRNVAPLEFDVLSNGKPTATYAPPPPAGAPMASPLKATVTK